MSKTAVSAGAAYLGVVSLGELKRIRKAGIAIPVLLLNYIDPDSVFEALRLDASFTVVDKAVLDAVASAALVQQKKASVHLKIDTGMHRAGCGPDQLLSLAKHVVDSSYLELEGIFTHFAESESTDESFTRQQLQVFDDCIELLRNNGIKPHLIHCSNSAAIINFPEAHFNLVRPGLIMYGHNPFPKEHAKHQFVEENFKSVLSLKTQVVYVRTVEVGETVGYNRLWQAERTSRVALLPVGYGDGYRRTPHNAGRVLINGQYAPIIGNVAMDQTTVDVTDIENVQVGDEVVLLGMQGNLAITAEDIAQSYGTVDYEVLTSLSERVERVYLRG
jgi:alanine racemase